MHIPEHWLSWLLISLLLGWLLSLLLVRWWTRRQLLRQVSIRKLAEEPVELPFAEPNPADQQAREVIRAYRRRFLLQLWPDLEFSWRGIIDLTWELVQKIARVYYPDEERPELKATLYDLIELQSRINDRLRQLFETMPLKAVREVELETILQAHDLYKKFTQHPLYRFCKRHRLDELVRFAWLLKNLANPWYWGYRATWAGGKEFFYRYFLARLCTIVGEEAIRLYGRRPLHASR